MNALKHLKLCLLAGLFLAGIVGCGKQTAEKPTVQGRWSGFEQGRREKTILAFNGDQFAYWDAQSNKLGSGTFVVNDTMQPAQMDLTFLECPAPEYVGKVGLAIYELQRDELKIAGSEPGSTQRPTNIAGGEGIRVFTLKRE